MKNFGNWNAIASRENWQNVCNLKINWKKWHGATKNWLMNATEINGANKFLIKNREIRMSHRFYTGRDPI